MSTSNPSPGGIREIDWLSPAIRELLDLAEQKAQQQGAKAIYPEHLLLCLIEHHSATIGTLLQQSQIDLPVLLARTQASFPSSSLHPSTKSLRLAPESLECIERAIALVTYYLSRNRVAAVVLPEHLLLSIFYHPRMQKLFASFSTSIFKLKNVLVERTEPGFARHLEQVFLFPEKSRDGSQKIVHFAHLSRTRHKHVLRSIEYPDLTFSQILGLSQAKQAVQESIAFLRQPQHFQESSHGWLLLSQHMDDDMLFVRAIAGEAGVPLSVVFCSTLVEMFVSETEQRIQAEQAELAYQLVREVFYPIKMFSHCLIYFQGLEALAIPEVGQRQRYIGWKILQGQFLAEFDKLKRQPGTVVFASTSHPQQIHTDFLRPGRLDQQVDLYKPVQLLREEPKHALPSSQGLASCPACQRPVQKQWKHCVYCRHLLVRHCEGCGTVYPEVAGARFCSECGSDL